MIPVGKFREEAPLIPLLIHIYKTHLNCILLGLMFSHDMHSYIILIQQ